MNTMVAALALIWWPLRMLYADNAYLAWRLIQWEHMDYGRWRFASVLTQWPPWLSVQLNAPINVVLAVYSFALQLPLLALAYFVWRKKQWGTAWLCLLASAVLPGFAWFLPVSEIYIALAFALLWFSLIQAGKTGFLLATLPALAFITHPGVLPFLVAVFFFDSFSRRKLRIPETLFFLLAVVLKTIFSDPYEMGYGSTLLDVGQWHASYVWKYLHRNILQPEVLITILGITGTCLVAIMRKQARLGLVYLAFCASLTLLAAVIYSRGDSDAMMAKNLLPVFLAFFIPIGIKLNEPQRPNFLSLRIALTGVTAIFACWSLNTGRETALNRLKTLERMHNRMEHITSSGKIILHDDAELAASWFGVSWALPYESLLFSAWKSTPGAKQRSVRMADDGITRHNSWNGYFLGAPFEKPMRSETLNKRYFHLSDSGYLHLDMHLILPLK
jgi:hypothetical protein